MENMKYTALGEETIGKLIWKMSIPSVIGILSYNLYNIIDTIYISRGIGAYAAGGLAITFPLFILLSAISSTIGSGAASVISRALGKQDVDKASNVAANTFGFFWVIAIVITIVGTLFMDQMLYGMGVTENLLPYAREYTKIILLGAITSTGFSSLIRAEGNSKFAMYLWVIPVFANIVLDPIFIFVFKLGVMGAAIATVLSQCVSLGMSMYFFFFSGKSHLRIKLHHFYPNILILREIISIGLPSFLQMASNSLTIILINNVLKQQGGDYAISSYGIVNKISTFMIIPLQGIVQGIQPIIGYNHGAGKKVRVNNTLKSATIIAAGYGIIISIMLFILSNHIMKVFSSDVQVIEMGSSILKIANWGLVFSGVYMIQMAYFQSIGNTKVSLLLCLSNYVLCFVPVILLMSFLYGLKGVWLSFPLSAIMALCISSAFIIYLRRDNRGR